MLVIANEAPILIGTQSGFAGAAKSEQQSDIAIDPLVSAGVQREYIFLRQ